MRLGFVAALLFLCAGVMPAGAEEPPAALVMAVTGKISPPVAAMSEIASGAPVRLEPGAELTLLDYARCKMVTVSGGTVTVTRFDFITDGRLVSEQVAPCPRIHQLSAASGGTVAGGLVMRGMGAVQRWPLNREFVIAGAGTDALKAAAIYAEGKFDAPLVKLDVSSHKARYPSDAPSLAADRKYVLRLSLGDRAEPADITFIGTASTGPTLLVVLHSP